VGRDAEEQVSAAARGHARRARRPVHQGHSDGRDTIADAARDWDKAVVELRSDTTGDAAREFLADLLAPPPSDIGDPAAR
jgi:hypothetical protein